MDYFHVLVTTVEGENSNQQWNRRLAGLKGTNYPWTISVASYVCTKIEDIHDGRKKMTGLMQNESTFESDQVLKLCTTVERNALVTGCKHESNVECLYQRYFLAK